MQQRAIFCVFKRSLLVRSSHSFFRKHQDKSYYTTSPVMNSLQAFSVLIVLAVAVLTNVTGTPYPGSPNCDRSEVYSRCDANPPCQKTCDNYDKPIACTRSGIVGNICYPGCVCKEGFVRVVQGDQCIPINKCEGRVKH